MRVGIVDYGMGNLRSVEWALQYLGVSTTWVQNGDAVGDQDALVLPGVGAFPLGMQELADRQLLAPLQAWLAADKAFLGICLGYQMLFTRSSEGQGAQGLGIFPGSVDRFDVAPDHARRRAGTASIKVPQIGWNDVAAVGETFAEFDSTYFYFVHGYAPFAPLEAPHLRTTYGQQTFTSGAAQGKVWGAQFHPERSGEDGLRFLRAFLKAVS